ncbi:MAG: TIGR03435 family protein [Bryobacteraceae bacterium]
MEFRPAPLWTVAAMAAALCPALTSNAQPTPQNASAPAFEVASIKPLEKATWLQISPQRSGGRISWQANLYQMVLYAYHLPAWRVTGLPQSDAIFQVDASTDAASTTEQIRQMLQSLLANRFKLAAHRETKELNGYNLTVSKSGLKLREAKLGDPPAPLPEWFAGKDALIPEIEGKAIATMEGKGITAVTGRGVTMADLANALQAPLGTFVANKTGLTGKYYFGIKFLRDDAPPDADAPTLAQAVQELGLRLEKEKGPVEILVIDHLEKMPTEN